LKQLQIKLNDPQPLSKLVDGKRLARNTFFNLFGYGIPLIAAVFTIPIIIRGLGTDRFGILTLAWVLIGYLGLFDMGLGRALTKLVAEKLGSNLTSDIPSLIWTALLVMGFIGIVVAAAACVVLPWMAWNLLKIPPHLSQEAKTAFLLLALFVPIIIISVGFRGVLDAYQRFDLTNAVRIPLGLFTFVAPLLVMPFSISLVPLLVVLMAGRLAAMLVQLGFCLRTIPGLRKKMTVNPSTVGYLFKFGGWMTVTNIISPLMMYLDRFFIGTMISVAAVAYYATPGEVITKLLLISGSLMGVLFPAFSSTFENYPNQTIALFSRGIKYIYLVMFPIVMVILILAGEGLTFWLGTEFARQSTMIMKLMAVAIFFASLGQVPYSLIQGAGRPDITAKLHFIELPFYLVFLWLMIRAFGIKGAAFAWMIRAMIDSTVMYLVARRLLNLSEPFTLTNRIVFPAIIFGILMSAVFLKISLLLKFVFLATILCLHLVVGWSLLISDDEKDVVKKLLTSVCSH